jgi:3-hydroxy acid dehydrogenase / malonic semialdehyde reductase
MTAPLSGKTALITGASSGIGAAAARAFSDAGAHVLLAARRQDRLDALAAELPSAESIVVDVTDADGMQAAIGDRKIDVVLANAGLARGVAPIQEGGMHDWSEVIDTNIKGVLHAVRCVLPGMIERGRGDVVLLGSVAGRNVYPGGTVYCMTKYAVNALYEGLRLDAGDKGVRFTTIDPGMVETEFSDVRFHGDREKAATVYADWKPLQPADVADAILYAVSRPAHVNIGEIVLWSTQQASVRDVHKG